eukprot:Phypoly_transcript_00153.p1 GENE.Phypoly_transcript_00153~~Phypoly_transcript_00153.p1  ORF type:complete len:1043 (-),score=250.60 Phypoly_transcript_00153:3302-6352(-)
MESLVIKMLKKHLKLFIKNFKAEQLSVYATKGEGQMTDLDLNEAVIQELLYIPMNLAVTKSTCDLLTLKIPWTSLSSKPVTLTLNRVDIDLREPEEIKSKTTLLKKLKKKSSNEKPSSRSDIMDNAQLVVNSVHITVQTLGGSLMMIDLEDIVIQSTNGNWQVVDLGNSRTVEKDLGLETLYKRLSVRSITVALLTEKSAHMLLQQMPLQIQITQKRRIKDTTLQAAEIVFILEDVKFRWTRPEYLLIVDLIKGFQNCMARPIPEAPVDPNAPPTPALSPSSSGSGSLLQSAPDVSFSLRLEKWTIDFAESIESEKGYSFFGKGLVVSFNAAKANVQRVAEKTGETANTNVDESVISINISNVNFRELVPRSHVHPFLVSSKEQNGNDNGQQLLKATLILRRPHEVDASTKYLPLIGIDLSIALSNLQIVADRRVWKSLIKFLAIPITPEEKEKKALEKEEKKKEREKEGKEKEDLATVAQNNLTKVKDALRLGEDWFNQIKLNIKASDIRVVAPNEEKGLYQNVSLQLNLGSFVMANFSDWKITPNLSKGVALLAAPAPAPPVSTPKAIGIPQKLTFSIEGVSIAVHAGGRIANVLAPTGVKLFVHYYERETKQEKGKPHLEVIFQSGEFNLQANEQQFRYLAFLGRKYLNPRKIKAAMSSQYAQAKEAAKAKLDKEIKEFKETTPKEDMVTSIGKKAQSTLDAYKWIVYIQFNKGVFRVPLQFLLSDDPDPALAPALPAVSVNDTPLSPLSEKGETSGPSGPSIEEILGGADKNACELKYENMQLAFENNLNGQGVVVQLGSFQATGLDHPKLPSVITLMPLRIVDDDKANTLGEVDSLIFRYKRRRRVLRTGEEDTAGDEDYVTEVWFRLQGMQVKVTSKPNHPGIKTGMGLPDIQALVNKAVSLIRERESDIETLRKNVDKVNFDVKWGVELGNCEVLLEKEEANGTVSVVKPYGTVRLSDAQRQQLAKSYFEVEGQLINAKTNLALQEYAKEEYETKITALQNTVSLLLFF